MTAGAIVECGREADVLEAVAFGRWPDHAAELVTHVAACAVCADLADVARALHDDREAACREAPVPAAGIVWWRATIRARADAARTASRPITVAQGVAGACAVGLTCGLAGIAWRSRSLGRSPRRARHAARDAPGRPRVRVHPRDGTRAAAGPGARRLPGARAARAVHHAGG